MMRIATIEETSKLADALVEKTNKVSTKHIKADPKSQKINHYNNTKVYSYGEAFLVHCRCRRGLPQFTPLHAIVVWTG
eukprot:2067211-Amphidinium_carterae.1